MLSFFYFKSWEFIWILFFSIILLDWLLWNCKVVLLVNLLLWIWRADLLTVSYLFWSTRSGKLFLSIFLFIYFCKKVYGLLSSFIFYYNSTANLFFKSGIYVFLFTRLSLALMFCSRTINLFWDSYFSLSFWDRDTL